MINNKPYNKTSLILYAPAMCIHFSETSNNLIITWSYSNYTVSLRILCMIFCCVCSTNEKQYVIIGNAFVKQMEIK